MVCGTASGAQKKDKDWGRFVRLKKLEVKVAGVQVAGVREAGTTKRDSDDQWFCRCILTLSLQKQQAGGPKRTRIPLYAT